MQPVQYEPSAEEATARGNSRRGVNCKLKLQKRHTAWGAHYAGRTVAPDFYPHEILAIASSAYEVMTSMALQGFIIHG